MFAREGKGGSVKYGYRIAASVGKWAYKPTAAGGAGTVDLTLHDEDPVWMIGDDFSLVLTERNGRVLTWPSAEMLSESQFIVPTGPIITQP